MDPQRVDASKKQSVSKTANETVGNSDDCFESQIPRPSTASQTVELSGSVDDVQSTAPPVKPHVPADDEVGQPVRYRRHQSDPLGVTGKVLNDRYEVTNYLSRGSFGYVYRGRDKRFDRGDDTALVAIKFMQLTPHNRSGFEREAQLMKRFHHPHFVDVYDFGEDADGLSWLVMEYVAGRTLDDVLRHGNGPVDRSLVVKFAEQVLPAMNSAHRKNLIHRDLKPANIMVINDGDQEELRFKIMDFGTSAQIDATDTMANQTMNSAGTPMFMAPEQVSNSASSPRSDLYSIGVILFQMLSGKLPFELKSVPKVLHDVVYAAPPKLSSIAPKGAIPRELDRLIAECLSKNPAGRPADLNVVRDRLLRILATSGRPRRFGLQLLRAVTVVSLLGVIAAFMGFLDRGYFSRPVIEREPVVEHRETHDLGTVAKDEIADHSPAVAQDDPDVPATETSGVETTMAVTTESIDGQTPVGGLTASGSILVPVVGASHAMNASSGAVSSGFVTSAAKVSSATGTAMSTLRPSMTLPVTERVLTIEAEPKPPVVSAIVIEEDLTAGEPADAMLVANKNDAGPATVSIAEEQKTSVPVDVSANDSKVSDAKMNVSKGDASVSTVDGGSRPTTETVGPPKMSDEERLQLEKQNAENAVKLNHSGMELQSIGKYAEAVDVFDTALRLDPKQVLIYVNRGSSKLHLHDLEGAVDDYNEAIQLDPKNVEARLNRGDALRQIGQIEKALVDLNEAIALDSSRPAAFSSRSLVHRHKGDLKHALADMDKAIALSPKVAEYFNSRGDVYRALGESEKAIHDYTEAFRLNPLFATALVNRGVLRREMGDEKRAVADFNAVLFFDPQNKAAQKELAATVKHKEPVKGKK